ncbi:MAG: hypothetical protein Kow0059_08320 [Candidatus Sumerlaeia bacterium]
MAKPFADLIPRPLPVLLDQMLTEFENHKSIFYVREREWYRPGAPAARNAAGAGGAAFDFSVTPFAMAPPERRERASTPFGPAAGPHTQMSQNLVLGWLCGARIIELKTVQILDELTINRPCIHIPNVGFNIEWSQELHVEDSLREYMTGAMLIRILQELGPEWGQPEWRNEQTIFDMSIGYDLKGIRSEKVSGFLHRMMNAGPDIDRLRALLTSPRHRRFRDLNFPQRLSGSITLSTFHGCPPEEIERICTFLLDEIGVHVCVKMNPTMLGREAVSHLLHDVMGYRHLMLNDKAFETGLQYSDSLDICHRLQSLAQRLGLSFTAKFTNTLELRNTLGHMPDEIMYLSGPPLYVISSTLAAKFRTDYFNKWGGEIGVSFSAGIDKFNFAEAVACGFRPVTACTDLLKTGGYARASSYLEALGQEFARTGARTVEDYIRARARELNVEGAADAATSLEGLMRGVHAALIPAIHADPRYRWEKNQKEPPRIDSHLRLFDCIACNKCIPVCPNAANFAFPSTPGRWEVFDYVLDGDSLRPQPAAPFEIKKKHQIGNFFDWCNECGNCDTYCPEYGGPFIEKPSFFGSLQAFDHFTRYEGACVWEDQDGWHALLRWRGGNYSMRWRPADNEARVSDGALVLRFNTLTHELLGWDRVQNSPPEPGHRFAGEIYHTLLTIVRGFSDPGSAHLPKAVVAAPQ